MESWRSIVNTLADNFDGNELMFKEVKNLSKNFLGPATSNIKNGRQYFEVLENNLDSSILLDFLIILMDHTNFHLDMGLGGEKIAEILRQHHKTLVNFKTKCMSKDIYDENFIGREEEIKNLTSILTDQEKQYRGLNIYGKGGVGKTSLANEVCRRLWADQHWKIIKIELHEQKKMFYFLRDALMKLSNSEKKDESCDKLYDDLRSAEEDLKNTFINIVRSKQVDTALLLDNCDGFLDEEEEEAFLRFLSDLLREMKRCQRCKVRVIVTSRRRLNEGENSKRYADFQELLVESEIKALKCGDAVRLVKKCTKRVKPSDEQCEELVKLCDCIPLGLRTVCSTLNIDGSLKPSEMIRLLQADRSTIDGIEYCLRQTFNRLNDGFKSVLMQLCIFKTASFNVKAAADVLLCVDKEGTLTAITKFKLLYLKSRHLLEIQDKSIQENSEDDSMYSIHPRVWEFIEKMKKEDRDKPEPKFTKDIEGAKRNFVVYYKNILDKMGETLDFGQFHFHSFMKENSVHVLSFFDALSTVSLPGSPYKEIYSRTRHLSDLSELFMFNKAGRTKRINLIEKWMNDANLEGNPQLFVLWRTEYVFALLEMNDLRRIKKVVQSVHISDLEKTAKMDSDYEILGRHYHALGRYFSVLRKGHTSLKNFKRSIHWYGKSHSKSYSLTTDLADVYNSFGCYYFDINDTDTAKLYYEKALDKCNEHANHHVNPNVRDYLTNVASCFYQEGVRLHQEKAGSGVSKFEESLKFYNKAIELEKEATTDEKEPYMGKLANRASVHVMLEKFEEASADASKVLEVRKKILPAGHMKITYSEALKGEVMFHWATKTKDIDERFDRTLAAERCYHNAMQMMRKFGFDKEHKYYSWIREMHLVVLKKLGDKTEMEQADEFYRRFECGEFDDEQELQSSSHSQNDGDGDSSTATDSPSSLSSSASTDGEFVSDDASNSSADGSETICVKDGKDLSTKQMPSTSSGVLRGVLDSSSQEVTQLETVSSKDDEKHTKKKRCLEDPEENCSSKKHKS